MLAQDTVDQLTARFDAFDCVYSRAIEEFAIKGVGNSANLEQLEAYAALLEAIVSFAKGDRNRDRLLKPILQIGTAPVEEARRPPSSPLGTRSVWPRCGGKPSWFRELVKRLLTAPELAGDTRLFFKDLEADLTHPLYPEIAAIWIEANPQLLSLSDVVQDYSLHEPSVLATEGSDETNDNPAEGSACVPRPGPAIPHAPPPMSEPTCRSCCSTAIPDTFPKQWSRKSGASMRTTTRHAVRFCSAISMLNACATSIDRSWIRIRVQTLIAPAKPRKISWRSSGYP